MKTILAAMTCVLLSSFAFAKPEVQRGELDLRLYNNIIASSAFANALAEANSKVNGQKIRIFYSSDHSSRTTVDTLKVVVVGRTNNADGATFQKAEFEATSLSGGMYPTTTTELKVTTISQEEFAGFYE